MPLSITNVTMCSGGNHWTVTVDYEGTTRQMEMSKSDVDDALGGMTATQQVRQLLMLWMKYRRAQGRSVQNVEIA